MRALAAVAGQTIEMCGALLDAPVIVSQRTGPARAGETRSPSLSRHAPRSTDLPTRLMRRFAALLAVVLVAACTNEIDTSTRPEAVIGSYQLRSYGGQKLPVVVSTDQNGTAELLSGELVIAADKSWTEARVYRYTLGGVAQNIEFGSNGSWVLNREGAFMEFNDKALGYQFTGTAAGGSLTLYLSDGATAIYSH
jgi:hypothetical protein